MGFSRLTVPSGGSLTVTFQAASVAIRIATQGAELDIAQNALAQTNGAKNSVGGLWPNPWFGDGQTDGLVLTDNASAGVVPVDLFVTHSPVDAVKVPTDKSILEGGTEPHANS